MAATLPVRLQGVQQTLLIPLWARAKERQKPYPLINDSRAAELLTKLGADVSQMDRAFDEVSQLSWAVRAKMMDEEIKRYLAQHPCATVVSLGAGLDTTFERIDNGQVRWYDLDLPDVIQLRQTLIPETERSRCIAKSIFDLSWCDDMGDSPDGVFLLACGLLTYFPEQEVRGWIAGLATRLPGSELVFDAPSRLFLWRANRSVFKRGGMVQDVFMRWGATSAKQVAKWDKRIRVLDEYSWFARIEMDPTWSKSVINTMRWTNRLHALNIFHMQFAA